MVVGFTNAYASSEMTHSAPQSQTQTPRRRSRRPLSRVGRSRCTVSLNHADIFLPAAPRSAPPVLGHPCRGGAAEHPCVPKRRAPRGSSAPDERPEAPCGVEPPSRRATLGTDTRRVTGQWRTRPSRTVNPREADRGLGPGSPASTPWRASPRPVIRAPAAPPLPHPPARQRRTTKPRRSRAGRRPPSAPSPPGGRHAAPLPSSTAPCPKAQPSQASSQLQASTQTAKERTSPRMEAAEKWLRPRHRGGGVSESRLRRRRTPEPARPGGAGLQPLPAAKPEVVR